MTVHSLPPSRVSFAFSNSPLYSPDSLVTVCRIAAFFSLHLSFIMSSSKAPNPCADLSAESLKCIEAHYSDKSVCQPFFDRYKACKKQAYEDARLRRIRARDGLTS